MPDERFTVQGPDGPFSFTVAWWHNALVTRRRLVGGAVVDATAWYKHLSHGGRGWYDHVAYGQVLAKPQGYGGRCSDPAVEQHDGHGHQAALVCCRASRLLVVDVDDPDRYAASRTSQHVSAIQAMARRGAGWHAYVVVPPDLAAGPAWPRQGPIPGGDVKSAGFVPMPGSYHYLGERYEPTPDGELIPATGELLAALRADRAEHDQRRGGAGTGDGGERGEGNEPTLLGFTGSLVAAGYPVDEAWGRWLAFAQTLTLADPTWPWTEADRDVFDRHWAYCQRSHEVNHPVAVAAPAAVEGGHAVAHAAHVSHEATEPVEVVEPTPPASERPERLSEPVESAGEVEALTAGAPAGGGGEPPHTVDGWRRRALDGDLPAVAPAPDDPMAVARFLLRLWRHPDGPSTLARWRGDWLAWLGSHWAVLGEEELRTVPYRVLEDKSYERATANGPELREWKPDKAKVDRLLDALRAVTSVSAAVEPGTWLLPRPGSLLGGDAEARLVPCRNALVNPLTREVIAHSPRYFNTHALPFDHDPQATCPRWLTFLESAFPGDAESQALLQEWFGYVLSGRTNQQKLMFLHGAKRSGKGLTAGVLAQLLGEANVAAPTLSAFATGFGLVTLLNKPLAVIGDARTAGKDTQVVIERLLSITGEDRLDVDRKYREPWTGKLPTRILMMSNELPRFPDASNAVTDRMLVLVYRRSFLGREDLGLRDALASELAGILNWALDGLGRLDAAGRFTVPAASADVVAELNAQASPVLPFLEERCQLDDVEAVTPVSAVYDAWVSWCAERGRAPGTDQTFGAALRGAAPSVTKARRTPDGLPRCYCYVGLRLTTGWWKVDSGAG